MNNKTLKKVLLHMSNGKALKEIGQFVDMEWRTLRTTLLSLGVESPSDARKKLKQLNEADAQLPIIDRSAKDTSGEHVPEWKPEPVKQGNNFDRAAAIVNDKKNNTQERIPLAEHKEFRRDMKDRPWVAILHKWGESHKLSEELLMEQAILLAPTAAKERFGFNKVDNNMEDKKLPR